MASIQVSSEGTVANMWLQESPHEQQQSLLLSRIITNIVCPRSRHYERWLTNTLGETERGSRNDEPKFTGRKTSGALELEAHTENLFLGSQCTEHER